MGLTALVSQHEDRTQGGDDATPYEHHVTPVPTQALARLDRFATTSLLATGLAHEIANPLSTLMAALDWTNERVDRMRKQGAADPTQIERLAADVELATISARTITALVRDFQLFLRPDEITPVIGAAEVKPAIERALQMARTRLGAVSPVAAELGDAPSVRVPSTRITQIVLNLLLNAADALADRPWSANLVEVHLGAADGRAVIEVRDNGPGMSPETRRHLFEPGHTGNKQGTSLGLGLAISRQLARLSGGDVTVTCPPGGGTLFRVVLPPAS
jgi:signal transduction histidine kinase